MTFFDDSNKMGYDEFTSSYSLDYCINYSTGEILYVAYLDGTIIPLTQLN